MNKKHLLTTFLFCLGGMLMAQQSATVSGQITDQSTKDPLIAATIQIGQKGTLTDFDGYFSMQLSEGTHQITVRYVGYKTFTQTIELKAGENFSFNAALEEQTNLLQTATVTSGKYEKPLGEVTVSLEVLKPSLIQSTNKPSLDEALQKVPGVTIIDGQANIRGGSGFSQGAGSRVLLLVDDIPILNADAGFPNWDDVPVENIDQIEVVKGAASALYGSAALNGIVNVRTSYPNLEPETKAAIGYTYYFSPKDERLKWWDTAPYHLLASLSHKQKFKKFDLVLGGFYNKKESYNKDTYNRYGRFNIGTRYRVTDRLSLGVNANFNAGESASFFYWASDTSAYVGSSSTATARQRVRYNIDPYLVYFDKNGGRHRLLGRYHEVNNDNDNNQSNFSYTFYGEYQYQKQFQPTDMVFTAGLVGRATKVEAELYGDTTFTSQNLAAYLQLDKKFFNRLNVSLGVRFEANVLNNPGFVYDDGLFLKGVVEPSKEKESRPVMRLGLNYQLADFTYLRGSWGQGYRFPTIAEKFIFTNAGFPVVPNPTLGSETGWSGELAIKQGFRLGGFEGFVDLATFIMRYQDMIEFNINSQLAFQAVNIGGTEITGAEISIAGKGKLFGLPTTILTGYSYIDPKFLDFDLTPLPADGGTIAQKNANNSSSEKNVLKYRSRHTIKFDLETQINKFNLGLESFYNSQLEAIDAIFLFIVPGLGDFRAGTGNGFWRHNLRMAYRFSDDFKCSILLGNITNKAYTFRPGLLEEPRNIALRLDYKF
ncbi:MAG: TonB-dependent receptor [Saprospiraceae bacterium]